MDVVQKCEQNVETEVVQKCEENVKTDVVQKSEENVKTDVVQICDENVKKDVIKKCKCVSWRSLIDVIQKSENMKMDVIQKCEYHSFMDVIQKCEENMKMDVVQKCEENVKMDVIQKCEENMKMDVVQKCEENVKTDVIQKCEENMKMDVVQKCEENMKMDVVQKCEENVKTDVIQKCEENAKMDVIQKCEQMNEIYCFNKKADENNYEIFCFLCKKMVTGLNEIIRHIKMSKHKVESERIRKKKDRHYECMKNTNGFQLSNILEQQLLTEQRLTKDDFYLRDEVCKRFEECLQKMIAPDVHCRLYGSSLTMIGFKSSSVDIDIKFDMQKVIECNPLVLDPPCFFSFVVEAIRKQTRLYSDLEDNLNMKVPTIKFKDKKSGLSCCIAPFYSKCYHISDLIIKYTNADERCFKLAMLIRLWGQLCGLDNADNGGLSPYCLVIMVINYLQHTESPVLPIIKITGLDHEVDKLIDLENEEKYSIPYHEIQHWMSKNTDSIAVLFIGFLHYFLVTFHHHSMIVNIRQHAPLLRDARRYGNRRLVIEDPFINNLNVGKSLGSQTVMNYLTNCMEITLKYCIWFKNRVEINLKKENKELKTKDDGVENGLGGDQGFLEKSDEWGIIHVVVSDVITDLLDNVVKEVSYIKSFNFATTSFAPKTQFPKFCSSCKSEGHGHTSCEVENFIVKPLQPLNKASLDILNQVCVEVMTTCEMTGNEFDFRMKILKKTENHFKEFFDDKCRLSLFGSSVNGFGFRYSDLDICLRFESNSPPKDLNYQLTVGLIEKVLKKSPDFYKVFSIKSAKVPIVKFRVKNTDIDGDMSLYNCLALVNSKLLKTYAAIDQRVRIMGYCIKYFAKICEIGDASRGSLSSYAYILLMLYYLQHCEPPIVPVLQELAVGKRKPVFIDEKDTWFFDDIKNLDNVWKDYGKNKQSIAELWIGFFNFYVEKFSFKRSVVSIRQKNPLSKFQKSWQRYSIAIEDPFDLDHNLGAGLTDNMFKYIVSIFKRARLHFGSPVSSFKKSKKEYYFDRSCFTEENVPNDRCCRNCGKIGHGAANCRELSDSDENVEQKSPTKEMGLRCYNCNQRGHRKQDCTFQIRRQRQDSDSRNQKWRNDQEKQIENDSKISSPSLHVPKKKEDTFMNKNADRLKGAKKQPKGLNDEEFPVLSPVGPAKSNFIGKQSSVQNVLPQQLPYNISNFFFNPHMVSNSPPNLPQPPPNLLNHPLSSPMYKDVLSIKNFNQLSISDINQIFHQSQFPNLIQPLYSNELEQKHIISSNLLNAGTSQKNLPSNVNQSPMESHHHLGISSVIKSSPKVGQDQLVDKKGRGQSADKNEIDRSLDRRGIDQSADKKKRDQLFYEIKKDQSAEKTNGSERPIAKAVRRVVAGEKNNVEVQSDKRDVANTSLVSNQNVNPDFSNTKSLIKQSSTKRDISNTKSPINQVNTKRDVSNTKLPINQSNSNRDIFNMKSPINQCNTKRDISNKNGNYNNIKGNLSNSNSPGNQSYVDRNISNTKSSSIQYVSDNFNIIPIDDRSEIFSNQSPYGANINQTSSGLNPSSRKKNNRGKFRK